MKPRIIIHLDMDAFFTAIEQRENPQLKGKPVVVGADPQKGKGRGVVSTASYEARKFGLHSAQPISQAYRKCPHCIFLPVNMVLYQKVSQKVIAICQRYADKFEQISVDETYLDISQRVKDFEEAKNLALKIKQEIKEKEKLTCSIGIGPNKAIAKIASDYQKPDGLTIVLPEKVKEFLWSLPVEKISGVGPKTREKLDSFGIRKISQLAKMGEKFLTELFGQWGKNLYLLAQGIDESEVIEEAEAKSLSKEYTFPEDVADSKIILKTLDNLAKKLHQEVQKEKVKFKTILIKIRYANFETHTHQVTLGESTNKLLVLLDWLPDMIKPFLESRRKVRLVGVKVANLEKS